MLTRLSEQISWCYERAAEAKQRAEEIVDPVLKADFLGVEKRWLFLARSYGFVERLKDFTSSQPAPKLVDEHSRKVADLTPMASLLLAGNSCADPNNTINICLTDIVEAAVSITGADKGNLQLWDDRLGALTIMAQSGFDAAFLKFFERVTDQAASCHAAAMSNERVVIEDIRESDIFANTASLKVLLTADVQAVQSTPLVSSRGKLLGMISTHYKSPYRPTDRQLMFMDMLARQAADYIERKQLEEVTQQRTKELETAREHNDVLLRELQHRCNNLMSVVQTLVQRTLSDAGSTLDEAKSKLLGRLRALSHSTRQMTKSDWAGVSLVELVRVTTDTFSTRIETYGDEVVLDGKDAQNVALALHELATNAAKYGALRIPEGKISVSWSVEQTASGKLLKVGWQEHGGPPTTVPRRKGFGTALLTSIFSEASLDYAPDGLSCQFSMSIAPPLAKHFDEARLPGF